MRHHDGARKEDFTLPLLPLIRKQEGEAEKERVVRKAYSKKEGVGRKEGKKAVGSKEGRMEGRDKKKGNNGKLKEKGRVSQRRG